MPTFQYGLTPLRLIQNVISPTDAARKTLNDNSLKITFEYTEMNCKCVIKDTMKDIKYKKSYKWAWRS